MTDSARATRNVLVTFASNLAMWAISFVVTIYLPKYLGATGFGKLMFVGSFLTVFGVFVTFGTSTPIIRDVARDHAIAPKYLASAYSITIPFALAAGTAATSLSYYLTNVFHQDRSVPFLVFIASIAMVTAAFTNSTVAVMQGLERFPRLGVVAVTEKLVNALLTIALILSRAKLWAIVLVTPIANVVAGLLCAFYARDVIARLKSPALEHMRILILAGIPFVGWAVFNRLYGYTDPLVMKLVSVGYSQIGWYGAATRFSSAMMIIPASLSSALMPILARRYQEDLGGFKDLVRRSFRVMTLTGLPASILLAALAASILRFMHYPTSFQHSIPVLQVGSLTVILMFVATSFGTALSVSTGPKYLLRSSIAAAILAIPACAIMSKVASNMIGNAAVGAIGSDVLVEILLIYCYVKYLPAGTARLDELLYFMRCVAAAAPMAGLFLLAHHFQIGTVWAALPATVLYAGAIWLLGCLHVDDIETFRILVSKKLSKERPEVGSN